MAKSIDFSMQLPYGADPVSPNGGLLVAAGDTQGKSYETAAAGSAIKQGVTDNLVADAAGAVKQVAEGYLDSNLTKDVKATVDKYQTATKFDTAVQNYDVLRNDSSTPPADLQAAQDKINSYKTALDQGVLTREQALLSIDKSVKEYSNQLPGYASQLRTLATQLTGVEHMGNYAEFSLLSKQSSAEKMAELQQKNAMELQQRALNSFVDKYKRIPSGGINGPDMKLFAQNAAVEAHAQDLKTQAESRNLTIQQSEPIIEDYVNSKTASGILDLNSKMQGLVTNIDPKTGRLQTPENKVLIRQQILSDVTTFFEGLKADVYGFNGDKLTTATRQGMLTRLETQQKDLVTNLQNQDSFDDFSKTMKISSEKAADVMNKWAIAHPQLKILQQSGLVTPDVAKLWIDSQKDPKRSADFRNTYGGSMDDYFKSVSSGAGAIQSNYSDNAAKVGSDPFHLDKLRDTDPGQYKVQLHVLRDSISQVAKQGWGEDINTQATRKAQFGTWLHSFANQVDPTKPDMVDAWTSLVSDPSVAKRIKELEPQEQLNAIEPIYTKTRQILENPTFGLFKRLGQLQHEAANNLGVATPFDVTINPLTRQLEIATPNRISTKAPREFTDYGKQGGAASLAYRQGGTSYGDGGMLGLGEVKSVMGQINKSLNTLNNFKEVDGVLPKDLQARGVNMDYLNKFNAGYFNLDQPARDKALNGGVDVPPNTQDVIEQSDSGSSKVARIQNNIQSIKSEMGRKGQTAHNKALLQEELDSQMTELQKATKFDTKLSAGQETKFKQEFPNAQDTQDYDMRGAFAAGVKPDERGHLPDTFKKPNHITFSDESEYSGKNGLQGGHWAKDSNDKWTFTPGKTNLQYHTVDELKSYFRKYEPEAKLILPKP